VGQGVRFHEAPPPSKDDVGEVAQRVRDRAVRWLRRHRDLQPVGDAAVAQHLDPVERERGPGAVADEALASLDIAGREAHSAMHIEPVARRRKRRTRRSRSASVVSLGEAAGRARNAPPARASCVHPSIVEGSAASLPRSSAARSSR
jgi:hypothetical protein